MNQAALSDRAVPIQIGLFDGWVDITARMVQMQPDQAVSQAHAPDACVIEPVPQIAVLTPIAHGFVKAPDFEQIVAPCCGCLLYTSPSPRDGLLSRMPSSA